MGGGRAGRFNSGSGGSSSSSRMSLVLVPVRFIRAMCCESSFSAGFFIGAAIGLVLAAVIVVPIVNGVLSMF